MVNGEQIQRNELAQECLAQFGKEVLEGVMNKYLITSYCDKQGIKITRQDVDEEIGRLAKKFSIPVDQWMQMLQQERGIGPDQYRQRHHLAHIGTAQAGGRTHPAHAGGNRRRL